MNPPCDLRPPNAVSSTMRWGAGAGLPPGNVRRPVLGHGALAGKADSLTPPARCMLGSVAPPGAVGGTPERPTGRVGLPVSRGGRKIAHG